MRQCGVEEKALVQDRRGVGADAHPVAALEEPGIDEAFAAGIGFAAFHAFDSHDSGGDGYASVRMNAERFRRDLLLLRGGLRSGGFYAGEELLLGLNGAVVVYQN